MARSEPLLQQERVSTSHPSPYSSISPAFDVGALYSHTPWPPIVFSPGVQSVDLLSTGPNVFDTNQKACTYVCSRVSNPFNWITFLHGVTTSDTAHQQTAALGQRQQQQQPLLQQESNFPARGMRVPMGEPAALTTLFSFNELIFRSVEEVNRAYKRAWLITNAVVVFFFLFVPLGWLVIIFIMFSSTCRKVCDDWAINRISKACDRVNSAMQEYGLGLLFMEGTAALRLAPDSAREMELPQVAMFQEYTVWVLRIFMLPSRAPTLPALNPTVSGPISSTQLSTVSHKESVSPKQSAPDVVNSNVLPQGVSPEASVPPQEPAMEAHQPED